MTDVYKSLLPMPSGCRVKELRVFQLLPKSRTDKAHDPRIGHPHQANARMLLGTVPVEEDGSAYFRWPARKPLYFQAVDGAGRAVQGMHTVVYLQPGERGRCVGCHERPGEVGADASPLTGILTGKDHRKYAELPDEHLRTLYLWLDGHVPFYGTYEEEDLQAQRLGPAIPPPRLQ